MSRNSNALSINTGDTVGQFVVVRSELVGKNKTWICRCRCGAEKRFWRASAINRQKTCGCGTDEAGLTAKQRRSMLSRMQGYKAGAKARGLVWGLAYCEFVGVATGRCFYCDAEPSKWDCVSGAPSVKKASPNAKPADYEICFTGVDRLNSSLGYTPENVVPCCVKCNRAKSDMSLSDFKNHVARMYAWLFPQE